jgi:hypothetical protein
MRKRTLTGITLALVATVLALIAPGLGSAHGSSVSQVKVTSTLDGKTVLPIRIHWIARPEIAVSKVEAVDFLIDGSVRWVEHHTPYYYGDDGNSLVTNFLTPGMHTFTVRAVTAAGTATDTVKARVVKAPAPPAELVGTWKHRVPGSCPSCKNGDAILSFTTVGWGSPGDRVDVRYLPNRRIVFGPEVITGLSSPRGAYCNGVDPLWTWAYTVAPDDRSFEMHPVGTDPCPDRQHGLDGTWTRVG